MNLSLLTSCECKWYSMKKMTSLLRMARFSDLSLLYHGRVILCSINCGGPITLRPSGGSIVDTIISGTYFCLQSRQR